MNLCFLLSIIQQTGMEKQDSMEVFLKCRRNILILRNLWQPEWAGTRTPPTPPPRGLGTSYLIGEVEAEQVTALTAQLCL